MDREKACATATLTVLPMAPGTVTCSALGSESERAATLLVLETVLGSARGWGRTTVSLTGNGKEHATEHVTVHGSATRLECLKVHATAL